METMSEKLKGVQKRNPDAFEIIGVVSGLGKEKVQEIANGAVMTIQEKIILEAMADG